MPISNQCVTFGENLNFSFDRIDQAVAVIGSANASLVMRYGAWSLDEAQTIPANIHFQIPPGGSLNGAYTLTVNGAFSGSKSCFGSTITVVFGTGSVDTILPKWWGETYTSLTKTRACMTASGIPADLGSIANDPTTTDWGTDEKGIRWFNMDAGIWKWWDGTQVLELTGGTGATDHGSLTGLTDDDHTIYRLESADHSHQSTGAQGGKLDHGAALDGLTDADHPAGGIAFTATDKLLGRSTAGAGAGEEIACTSAGRALLDDGTAAVQRATLKVNELYIGDYASLAAAITAIGATETTLVIDSGITLTANATIPATLSLRIPKGGSITKASTYTLTINGPFEAGLYQVFSGFSGSDILFGKGTIKGIRPEWFGAKADDSTDCTSAFDVADASAVASNSFYPLTVILGEGTYRVTIGAGSYAMEVFSPIKGVSPSASRIKNVGLGSAMRIQSMNFLRFADFTVIGNASSEDGITLGGPIFAGGEAAYLNFSHVDSRNHGRDGLVINHAWGTKFFDCKYYTNACLGVRLNPDGAHPGTKNAHVFFNCESRWNGGVTNNTGVFTKGGVLITNANGVFWIGGIVESNNAWGFIIGTDTAANNLIAIKNAYMESNPPSAAEAGSPAVPTTIGGNIYAASKYERVEVSGCYIAYGGILVTQTGYAFYVAGSPEDYSYFKEWGNYAVSNGGAGSIQRDSGLYLDWTKPYVSNQLVAGVWNVWYIDEVSNVSISGFVHIQAPPGTSDVGIYPFLVGYNTSGGSYCKVGASLITTTLTAPVFSYDSGNKCFQLTISDAQVQVAHIEMTLNGKQSIGTHAFPLIPSSGVWNDDFIKRAN
jgi:hypothetical protein